MYCKYLYGQNDQDKSNGKPSDAAAKNKQPIYSNELFPTKTQNSNKLEQLQKVKFYARIN